MTTSFENTISWVTGAGSGLGRSLSVALADRGATVVATDIDVDAAQRTAAMRPSSITAGQLDVTDAEAVEKSIHSIVHQHGRIDHAFNNAGIGGPAGELQFCGHHHWDPIIDVNLRGVINGISAAYPVMVNQRAGHIVNTASAAGLMPIPAMVPYSMTKFAVVGLSRALRSQASTHGVRVSVLCPATLETPMLDTPIPDGLESQAGYWRPDMRRYLGKGAGIKDADDFAHYALGQLARNRGTIVYGRRARVGACLAGILPSALERLARSDYETERQRQLAAK
jgi:NAD(P)-dependent dehydrogenase (short-subunit alcohol dehydrogenase family)